MNPTLLGILALLGGVGGFGAGLLGFGGGVLMFPLLYYVPPLLGLESLNARTVAAVVITEVFVATLVAGTAHWRSGRVQKRLTLSAGIASAAGSFMGGLGSRWVSESIFLLLFGVVTLLVAGMMFLPGPSEDWENTLASNVEVQVVPLALISCIVGVIVGFLGAGNFVFVPLLIFVLKVPTRIAIGSSLFIAMMNTTSGLVAKLLTGQIPLLMALAVVMGAAAGAWAGEQTHSHVSTRMLRYLYAGMVGLIMIRVWFTLLLS